MNCRHLADLSRSFRARGLNDVLVRLIHGPRTAVGTRESLVEFVSRRNDQYS